MYQYYSMYMGSGNRADNNCSEPSTNYVTNGSFKDEVEPVHLLLTLIHLSHEMIHITKYTIMGTLQLYNDYQELLIYGI